MELIVIGQNPSKLNKDQKIPFVGTRSHRILMEWISYIRPEGDVFMINVSEQPGRVRLNEDTLDDFKLRLLDRCMDLDYAGSRYKIIALGLIAHTALLALNAEHFYLPHPSGRNRSLNDKPALKQLLNECYVYIHSKGDEYEESNSIQTADERNSKFI